MGTICSCNSSNLATIPDNEDCIETINKDGQIRVYRSSKRHSINNNNEKKRRHSSIF